MPETTPLHPAATRATEATEPPSKEEDDPSKDKPLSNSEFFKIVFIIVVIYPAFAASKFLLTTFLRGGEVPYPNLFQTSPLQTPNGPYFTHEEASPDWERHFFEASVESQDEENEETNAENSGSLGDIASND